MQPPNALREALAQVIANERREWRRERDVIQAQSDAIVADLRARIVELESRVDRTVTERLAELRDGRDGDRGEQGPAGERGEPGEPGEPGPEGSPGRDGFSLHDFDVEAIDGGRAIRFSLGDGSDPGHSYEIPLPPGVPGDRGERGEPGAPGERGEPGSVGQDGERGPEGPTGKLPLAAEWEDRVHYEGEVATREGSTWQALCDTGRQPPHEDWRCIAAAGRDGADARSFRIRGTFADDGVYQALDVVALGGASFAARRDDPGPCPGDGWQLIAAQGKRGAPGERGPHGPKGDRGEPGSPVVRMSVDDEGMLTLTNGDGSEVTCDLYPVLAKVASMTP